MVLPKEGSTGWSDTWMVATNAQHPNCAYLFMNHIISPEVNAQATAYFGEAPSNAKACEIDAAHCETYHATDESYFENVWYWSTPQAQCLDGRTDVVCKDYSEWTQAWTEIKGSIRPPDPEARPGGPTRGLRASSRWLYRHQRVQLVLLLALPLGALFIIYFGSLLVMLANAFWTLDPFTRQVQHTPSLDNFLTIANSAVYHTITLRTILTAALVTLLCAVIGFPVAYYMARIAAPRTRHWLVVMVLLPLWASYLVKVFAWRAILQDQGVLNWLLAPLGLEGPGYGQAGNLIDVSTTLVFTYLWLPYIILPIAAGLERIPSSLLEASADLGGRSRTTFVKVVLPLALPAVVAGSIFTFSLTLGDYITPQLVSSTQFLGNVIYREVGVSGNLPLAAALATIPIVVMIVYLLVARRLGAFEAL